MDTKDAKALAQELNLSVQTVNARARILGLGNTVKASGESGRPRRIFTAAECDAIRNYGSQGHVSEDAYENEIRDTEDEALNSSSAILRQTVLAPVQAQLAAVDSHLSRFEEQASQALVHRINQVPSRILANAARALNKQSPEASLPFAEAILGLNNHRFSPPPRRVDASLI